MSSVLMSTVCAAALLGLPPDHSKGYFPNLERPNAEKVQIDRAEGPVILVVVDALRPDRMTPYGFARPTTPHLDALADEGLLLTNYYVNGNWTRPSTASMLTGLPPAAHGAERERDRLADQFVTLAEALNQADVPTGAVVGNGNAASAFGLARGFDFYADTVDHWQGLPSAEQVTELAVPFVEKHKDEPFFLMLFFVDPHDPYHAPAPYENMFVENPDAELIRTPHWEKEEYTPAQIKRMQATYDGAVRYTDETLGQFFNELRQIGVYDEATIMVTADHGEAFGEHGVFLHSHHLYDEIIRAPMIIRAPEMSRRGVYNHYLFQTTDLMPTLVRYFNGRTPESVGGVSIMEMLAHPQRNDPNRWVVSEFHNFGIKRRTVRSYTHKVIYQAPANQEEFMATVRNPALLPSVSFDKEVVSFFRIDRDPFEKKDVYSPKRARSQPWARMLKAMRDYRAVIEKPSTKPMAEHLDDQTYQDLKALGYIE
mgnify:CR=1 FL=1